MIFFEKSHYRPVRDRLLPKTQSAIGLRKGEALRPSSSGKAAWPRWCSSKATNLCMILVGGGFQSVLQR